jgi:hypothetical protein
MEAALGLSVPGGLIASVLLIASNAGDQGTEASLR